MSDTSSDDVFIKYQRLAAEFSKIRAQNQVLKKAVTDEQTKTSELKECLKEKDQKLRKLEQEMECLEFRNVQLTKRVQILQDELHVKANDILVDDSKSKSGRGHKSSPSASSSQSQNGLTSTNIDLSVLDAELKHKIAENAQLHTDLQALESEFERQMNDVRSQLQAAKADLNLKDKALNDAIELQKQVENQMSRQKEQYEEKMRLIQCQLQEARMTAEKYLYEIEQLRNRSPKQLLSPNVNSPTQESSAKSNAPSDGQDVSDSDLRIYDAGFDSMALDNLYSFYSKSVAYHDECVALQHRLSLVENEKSQANEELDEARQQINSLREEMEVSIKNYESQLRLMTEHVADLNDKLMAMSLDKELNSPNSSNKVNNKKSKK